MRLLTITILSAFCLVTKAIRGGKIDSYPTFNDDFEEEDDDEKSSSSLNIGSTIIKLGASGVAAGGAYIGYKFLSKAYAKLKERKGSDIEKDLDSTSLSRRFDRRDDVMDSRPGNFNATMIEEMKKEQEELWRFLHSIFKSQEEIVSRLDKLSTVVEQNANAASGAGAGSGPVSPLSDESFKELSQSFDRKLASFHSSLDTIQNRLQSLEDGLQSLSDTKTTGAAAGGGSAITPDDVKKVVHTEVSDLVESMNVLRKEVKSNMLKMLKDHDDAVVEKLRGLGEDLKKLVKSRGGVAQSASGAPGAGAARGAASGTEGAKQTAASKGAGTGTGTGAGTAAGGAGAAGKTSKGAKPKGSGTASSAGGSTVKK
jgi:hypothetical protein